jgi:glutamine synthetase
MHANFSNKKLRTSGDQKLFNKICDEFGKNIKKHMSVYGAHNELRLTGKHETQSIHEFSYGISDRGASIRIPMQTANDGYGYLEDRRPSANMDPYKVCAALMETVCTDVLVPA